MILKTVGLIAIATSALLSIGCATTPSPSSGQPNTGYLDPCAVGLSGQERLARMEKLGTVRQTGPNMYEVGQHRLLLTSSGDLISCR